ncbi:hypothetical protein [Virgibacillus dakarensis]|uniref:hypothetical protein n=1 Tax=Virgibacillus dakarensis TaxID=1917889 RepID=UPI001E448295|nr:hypothetical protein [Virgibacillus dakarensis]
MDRLELGNALKKIRDFLKEDPGKLTIMEERPVMGVWAVFQYNVAYVADEKTESSRQVWVNLLTNRISHTMKREQSRIMYQHEPVYTYPLPVSIDVPQAFSMATAHVKKLSEQQKSDPTRMAAMDKDINRITTYYRELVAENERRADRKGISEEKRREYLEKTEAIKLERDKQLQEIRNKYNGQIEINIDNGILYFVPILEYRLLLEHRGDASERILYYNPVTKQFFSRQDETSETAVPSL